MKFYIDRIEENMCVAVFEDKTVINIPNELLNAREGEWYKIIKDDEKKESIKDEIDKKINKLFQ